MKFYVLFGAAHYCTCGAALENCYLEVEAENDAAARREIWLRRCSRYSDYTRELPVQPHIRSQPLVRIEGNLPNSPRCFCGAAPQPSGPIGAVNQDVYDVKLQADNLHEIANTLHDLLPQDAEERVRRLSLSVLKLTAIRDYFHALLNAKSYDETQVMLKRGDYDD